MLHSRGEWGWDNKMAVGTLTTSSHSLYYDKVKGMPPVGHRNPEVHCGMLSVKGSASTSSPQRLRVESTLISHRKKSQKSFHFLLLFFVFKVFYPFSEQYTHISASLLLTGPLTTSAFLKHQPNVSSWIPVYSSPVHFPSVDLTVILTSGACFFRH